MLLLLSLTPFALAWPTASEWRALEVGGAVVTDPCEDRVSQPHWDIVGTSSAPAVYMRDDGVNAYFRMRINESPVSGGSWRRFGWGVAFETDGDTAKYDYMMFVDGKTGNITLERNTVGSIPFTFDIAEVTLATYAMATHTRYGASGADVCGDGTENFVDWFIPVADLSRYAGITGLDGAGMVFGTGSSSNSFQKDVAGFDGDTGTPSWGDVVSDVDADGDGLDLREQSSIGTDPFDADSDDDGLSDGEEWLDLTTDPLSEDTDSDGILDGTELGLTWADVLDDTDASAGAFVPDADPLSVTDPLSDDTDGGGLADGDEDLNADGAVDPGETDPEDPRDDDPFADADGDGINNATEDHDTRVDTDGDGTPDSTSLKAPATSTPMGSSTGVTRTTLRRAAAAGRTRVARAVAAPAAGRTRVARAVAAPAAAGRTRVARAVAAPVAAGRTRVARAVAVAAPVAAGRTPVARVVAAPIRVSSTRVWSIPGWWTPRTRV